MKTSITFKTSLFAATSVAAFGMAGLWAQDGAGKDAARDRAAESTQNASSQEDGRKQQFSGKLVSLKAYFSEPHGNSADKASQDKSDAPGSAGTVAPTKTISMVNTPLALLMSASTSRPGQAGQPGQAGSSGQSGTSVQPGQSGQSAGAPLAGASAGTPAEGQQIAILLFDTNNQSLAAKAQALCQSAEVPTAGNRIGAITGAETTQGAAGGESPQTKSVTTGKAHSGITVSVSGKKVTRGGVTVIFVEDIQGGE